MCTTPDATGGPPSFFPRVRLSVERRPFVHATTNSDCYLLHELIAADAKTPHKLSATMGQDWNQNVKERKAPVLKLSYLLSLITQCDLDISRFTPLHY